MSFLCHPLRLHVVVCLFCTMVCKKLTYWTSIVHQAVLLVGYCSRPWKCSKRAKNSARIVPTIRSSSIAQPLLNYGLTAVKKCCNQVQIERNYLQCSSFSENGSITFWCENVSSSTEQMFSLVSVSGFRLTETQNWFWQKVQVVFFLSIPIRAKM